MPLLRGSECLNVLRCPAINSTTDASVVKNSFSSIQTPAPYSVYKIDNIIDLLEASKVVASLQEVLPSGYTMSPSTGLAAIFLSIILLKSCRQHSQVTILTEISKSHCSTITPGASATQMTIPHWAETCCSNNTIGMYQRP